MPVSTFEKITLSPEEVKTNWHVISAKLDLVKNKTLIRQTGKITDNIFLEFFTQTIFDSTGAIKIKMNELDKNTSPLRDYFYVDWNGVNVRMTEFNSHYLLRGNMYYLSYMNIGLDLLMVKIFEELEEIEKILSQIDDTGSISLIDFVLILALLDNRKNHMFEILFALNQLKRITKLSLIDENNYSTFMESVQACVDDFYLALFSGNCKLSQRGTITSFYYVFDKLLSVLIANKELANKKNQIFRRYREANHPYQNALLAKKVVEKWLKYEYFDAIIGIEYGGIELPFVVNTLAKLYRIKQFPIFLTKYSHYSQKNDTSSVLSFYGNETKELNKLGNKSVLIVDDNVLTGKTIQAVVLDLKKIGVENVFLGFIGYSGKKRYFQMVMPKHGCINPDILLFSSLIVTESPYTRIYNSSSYKNKNGVFNKIETKIINNLKSNYPLIEFTT